MSRWSKNVRNRRFDALSRVDWRDFERLLADYYRCQGYRVEHCGTGANASRFDGGIDLKLYRDDAYLVVQCKHWNARQVTHNSVHELAGITLTERATGAILVTSGEFTRHAMDSAAKLGTMQLVDGDALRGMLGHMPEPQTQASPIGDRAERILAAVGERVLHAAEDRIRHGARRRTSRVATAFVWFPLVKVAVMILVAWGFITFVSNVLSPDNLLKNVATPVAASAQTTARQPMAAAPTTALAPHAPAIQYEIYVPRPPLTEAEIREQQRLADEAMRVLAPNTLEMDMGDPDDPRANDYYNAPEDTSGQSARWGR